MLKLLNRGKVRDLYEVLDGIMQEGISYRSKSYIIEDKIVLEPGTNAVIGTLFDDSELEKIRTEMFKEGNIDAFLDKMFLGN